MIIEKTELVAEDGRYDDEVWLTAQAELSAMEDAVDHGIEVA